MGLIALISWLIVGFVAGAVAKLLIDGKYSEGFVGIILIGIVGAIVGGQISKILAVGQAIQMGFDFRSFIFALVGSVVLLFIYSLVKGKP